MDRRLRHLSHLTRREALGMLGTGAGAGLAFAAGCGGGSAPPAESGSGGMEEAAGAMPDVTFPDGAVIRTILGDVDPATLAGGATLFHEHLDINQAYAVPPRDEARSRDNPLAGDEAEAFVELVSEELRMAAADGLSCIVDAAIYRRTEQELEFLRQMATRSGVAVVAAGAYWRAPFPENIAAMNVDELTEHLITDARGQHWGAFGEVGTLMEMHETERTFLHAVSRAHHATNLPILTHTEHQGCPPCGLETSSTCSRRRTSTSAASASGTSPTSPRSRIRAGRLTWKLAAGEPTSGSTPWAGRSGRMRSTTFRKLTRSAWC